MTTSLDLPHLRQWIGREQSSDDVLTLRLAQAYLATFDQDPGSVAERDDAPLGIHWCLHTPYLTRTSDLAPDGVPDEGGPDFLPPVPLPRRVRAGGELRFYRPLKVGSAVRRRVRVVGVEAKEGRSGTLCFVTIERELSCEGQVAMIERLISAYREAAPPLPATLPSTRSEAEEPTQVATERAARDIEFGTMFLMRFSALTYNAHRIHFDYPYAVCNEGYPGLVVHGPLQATILLHAAAEALGRTPSRFEFKAVRPLIAGHKARLVSAADEGALQLTILDHRGRPAMTATALG